MSFILRWKPSVMPLLRVVRHMQAIGSPILKRGGEGLQRPGLAFPQVADLFEQARDEFPAAGLGPVLVVHEVAQLVHFSVEDLEDRMGGEEFLKPRALLAGEPFGCLAQGGEVAAVAFEVGRRMARQPHEAVLEEAHDVEAVGDDAGLGEVAANQAAVRPGEVDADDLHLVAALELAEEGGQIRFAAAGPDSEDAAVLQVAEGGEEAPALVEGVLVDAEVAGAGKPASMDDEAGGPPEAVEMADAADIAPLPYSRVPWQWGQLVCPHPITPCSHGTSGLRSSVPLV